MKNLIKASAAVITSALLAGCNFAQPTPPCIVGHGGYAAKYTYVSGDTDPSLACTRTADIIGVQKYRQEGAASQIYLKPESLGYHEWGLPGDQITAITSGALDDEFPNDEGFCTVGDMDPITGILNEDSLAGATTPNVTYAFDNVRFYVARNVAGTQFSADLTITGPGCTTTYRVDAMYPVVFCNEEDADENPLDTPSLGDAADAYGNEGADGVPDSCQRTDHLWSHYAANPSFNSECVQYGNPNTTGADYDYAVTGSLTWQLCVPAESVPSLLDD